MLFILNLLLGIGLLFSGRKLFWLFVAAAGFIAGVQLTTRTWHGPEWLSILVGLAAGGIFALLAMALKSIAISVAGFLLGGSILLSLATLVGLDRGALTWVLYIVGGITGVILLATFFDWALIGLSSFGGASLLVETFNLKGPAAGVVLFILLLAGILAQSAAMRRTKKRGDD
jgi:hypothetical protein